MLIILTTIIFTNKDTFTTLTLLNVNKTINAPVPVNKDDDNNEKFYYERKEYRLPYRYPVGFLHSVDKEAGSIHKYDINS